MEGPVRIALQICRRQSVYVFYQEGHEYTWSDVAALNATVSDPFSERLWGWRYLSPQRETLIYHPLLQLTFYIVQQDPKQTQNKHEASVIHNSKTTCWLCLSQASSLAYRWILKPLLVIDALVPQYAEHENSFQPTLYWDKYGQIMRLKPVIAEYFIFMQPCTFSRPAFRSLRVKKNSIRQRNNH